MALVDPHLTADSESGLADLHLTTVVDELSMGVEGQLVKTFLGFGKSIGEAHELEFAGHDW